MFEWLEGFAVATIYYSLATLFAGRRYSKLDWNDPFAFFWALMYVLLWPLFLWMNRAHEPFQGD